MKREETIGFRVRNLSNGIRRFADSDDNQCPGRAPGHDGRRVTGMQGWVIGYLYENREREVFQRDMERQFSVRRPTMTAILQLMEKNGLITRDRVDSDGRLKRISLTPFALSLHERHEKGVEEFEKIMRSGISDSEMKAFFGVIDRIERNIDMAYNTICPEKKV